MSKATRIFSSESICRISTAKIMLYNKMCVFTYTYSRTFSIESIELKFWIHLKYTMTWLHQGARSTDSLCPPSCPSFLLCCLSFLFARPPLRKKMIEAATVIIINIYLFQRQRRHRYSVHWISQLSFDKNGINLKLVWQ